MRIPVRIALIRQETPTVKSFRLGLAGQEFSFLPGQWVDCYAEVDGRTEVAGFSITSSPLTRGTIDLAVKRVETNALTTFMHERARVGDLIYVDGGQGDFCYQREMGDSVALIGGGIGITPLMSILSYVDEAAPEASATLVYSARAPSELLFRSRVSGIAARNPRIRCLFTVTRPGDEPWDGPVGRIDARVLATARVDRNAIFYVSGPPAMVLDVMAALESLGVPPYRIKYESW